MSGVNPRVLLWLKATGLEQDTLERDANGDIKRVEDGGHLLPWTAAYMLWIQAQWARWVDDLGFRSHLDANLSGHPDAEFDEWLKENT